MIDGLKVITGRTAVVRQARVGELDAAARRITHDPGTSRWWSSEEEKVRSWLHDPHTTTLIIEADGDPAGILQVSEETDPVYRSASLDISVFDAFQERGIGTDALRAVAAWLFTERGHHRITIDPAADNERAIHVYRKVGFKPVGVMREYELRDDGRFHDGLLLDMLRADLTE